MGSGRSRGLDRRDQRLSPKFTSRDLRECFPWRRPPILLLGQPRRLCADELRKRFRTRQQREDWRKRLVFARGVCANAKKRSRSSIRGHLHNLNDDVNSTTCRPQARGTTTPEAAARIPLQAIQWGVRYVPRFSQCRRCLPAVLRREAP